MQKSTGGGYRKTKNQYFRRQDRDHTDRGNRRRVGRLFLCILLDFSWLRFILVR